MPNKKRKIWFTTIVVVLFIVLLTGFRFQWINKFQESDKQPVIVNGELDLREWDFSEGQTISLNGEWEFLPYELMPDGSSLNDDWVKKYIQVPGDWSEQLNPEDQSPYGYASYRLRIFVESDPDQFYSMQVPSVRSSSALYVNGLFSGHSGVVADNAAEADAFNVPYVSSSIRADENGVIDIVLQATNFVDPRSSGLVRSIQFGHENTILASSSLSTLLQLISAILFVVFAIFSCMLYVIGIRDRRFIYFALALLISALSNLMGGDEKVLFQYIQMDYTVSFKLSFISLIIFGWAMVHCVKPQIASLFKLFLPIYTTVSVGAIVVVMILPLASLDFASIFSLSYVVISAMITALAFLIGKKEFSGGIWLALASIALASHFGWWAYSLSTGLKVVYYPFDIMIAVICFAGVWFKQYHQIYIETKRFARELQEVDRHKDEFLANTSHELRNPLHSILNMSEAILEREQSTLQGRSVKDLQTVLSVSRRMSTMVNDLLDLTQIKAGDSQLQLQPCSLQAITVGVVDMLDYLVEGKPVQIINQIPKDFPLILADEKRVIQIVFNLLHNAIKFTNQGEIRIQANLKEDCAELIITDTGIGMTEDTIQTIFEPYEQGSQGEGGGFGLGLNISRKLVKLHGSTLEVQSVLNKGSTFSFRLPLADLKTIENEGSAIVMSEPSSVELNDTTASTFEEQPTSDLESARILVVDDDQINLQVIQTMLDTEGYDIQTVLSGEEALSLLDKKEWDLVIADVMMPQMSGYDLTRRIRERFSVTELPVLLLTARSQPIDIENGFSSGANDYVTKPMEALEFKSRVRALTSVKQSMLEKLQVEAAWLQAQIQPHFLFNALNTIIALSEIDIGRMKKVLEAFSHLLREKFKFYGLNEDVSIENELALIQAYLLIEQERFADRLEVQWEVDENVSCIIPALTIQPLVENAIHHGLMKRPEGGRLTVRISQEDSLIKIMVADNGLGMEPEIVENLLNQTTRRHTGIGLLNTDLRLKRKYGQGLHIESTKGMGTKVFFTIPNH